MELLSFAHHAPKKLPICEQVVLAFVVARQRHLLKPRLLDAEFTSAAHLSFANLTFIFAHPPSSAIPLRQDPVNITKPHHYHGNSNANYDGPRFHAATAVTTPERHPR